MYVAHKHVPDWKQFEQRVRVFLRFGMGLEDVPNGEVTLGGLRVDVCGGANRTFVCVMCSDRRNSGKLAPARLVRDIVAERVGVERAIRLAHPGKYQEFRFVLAVIGAGITPRLRQRAEAARIAIWSESYLGACELLYRQIGTRSRFYIFKELGCTPKRVSGSVPRARASYPAFCLRGKPRTYSLLVPASVLLDLAYVYRIQTGPVEAYQRVLEPRKLKSVAEYLSAGRDFKNNIIVSFDKRIRFRRVGPRAVAPYEFGRVQLPNTYACMWVIDGQHRLYGYSRLNSPIRDELLQVTAIEDLEQSSQAQLFIDINENQKPVDPNIVWSLYQTIQSDPRHLTLSKTFSALNESGPLKGRIWIPNKSPSGKRSYSIYIANAGSSLEASGALERLSPPVAFRGDESRTVTNLLNRFFRDVLAVSRAEWRTTFLFTNNGLAVLFLLLRSILINNSGVYESRIIRPLLRVALRQFFHAHSPAMTVQLASGGAGRQRTAVELESELVKADGSGHFRRRLGRAPSELQQSDPEILRELEIKLRKLVMKVLQRADPGRWWPSLIPTTVVPIAEDRKRKNESPFPWNDDSSLHPMYFVDFTHYSWIIHKNWSPHFQPIFRDEDVLKGFLRELEPIRHKIAHNRPALSVDEQDTLRLISRKLLKAIARAR